MGIRSQNNPIAAYLDVFSGTGVDASAGAGGNNFGTPQGITATGGSVSDYTTAPGDVYRAHIFTSTGTFNVTDITSDFGTTIEYVVVGGGGGGGNGEAGAGGAGGYRSSVSGESTGGGGSLESSITISSAQPYTVVVGGGGAQTNNGTESHFAPGTPSPIPAAGGGAGAYQGQAASGGSGGGSGDYPRGGRPGAGTANQGYAGGQGASDQASLYRWWWRWRSECCW